VHLGTGNYHPRTARAYTDYGLLSANEALGEDVHQVFMQLTRLDAHVGAQPADPVAVQLHDGWSG
jgi:polyphosphate kinase